MPYSWDDLDRGYYDPRYGTYMQTSRINWGRTAPSAYAGQVPGELLNGWYAPEVGTYVTPGDLDWSYVGRTAGLATPQNPVLNAPSKRPFKAYWREPGYQREWATWRYGQQAPATVWRENSNGVGPVQPAGAQPANTWNVGTLEEQAMAQGYTGIYVDESGKHPANADMVSDDGLVSYDAEGYQLDSNGNRAMGSFQIGGTRKGQSGYRRGAPKIDDFLLPSSMPIVEASGFNSEMWRPPSFPTW